MAIQEETIDNILHLNTELDAISIPLVYGAQASCNGHQIPSARIWELIGFFMSKGKQTPRDYILAEAKRAEIYRQITTGLIVWTLNPLDTDKQIHGNVYARPDRQRVRPILDAFGARIAKIDGTNSPEVLQELFDACATVGLYPCGGADNKYYFVKDPQVVFDALGTTDVQRIAIFCKRPGSSHINIRLDQV